MANLDRQRLASFVIARRMELGMRDRRALERKSGISDRTLGKVELGQSVNASTLGGIELALDWEPGSATRILQGGEPVIKGQQAPAPRRPLYADPAEQSLWERIADVQITGDKDEDERIKKGVIRYVRAARDDDRQGQAG